MSDIYFDNSAVNEMCSDKANRDTIFALMIKKKMNPRISIFTALEILSAEGEKGQELALIALKMGANAILGKETSVFQQLPKYIMNGTLIDWFSDSECKKARMRLLEKAKCNIFQSNLMAMNAQAEALRQKVLIRGMHEKIRSDTQTALDRLTETDRKWYLEKDASFYIHEILSASDPVQQNMVASYCRLSSTHEGLNIASEIIKRCDSMRFFMASQSYMQRKYSIRKNQELPVNLEPGGIDIRQAVYLAKCKRFVTSDADFFKMMDVILPFSKDNKNRRVLTYEQFREELIGK